MARTNLNRCICLAKEEKEILVYLLKFSTLASELLCEEAFINASLSPVEPEGNSFLEPFSLFSFGIGE